MEGEGGGGSDGLRRSKDEEAMQADNTHSTGLSSEQNEEPERGAVGGSDVRNDAKAQCVKGRPGVWSANPYFGNHKKT